MYSVSKTFEFSASHQLDLGPDHPCSKCHGHNYTVEVLFQAEELGENAMVLDYRKMGKIKSFIDNNLDHRHLNDLSLEPTAETLALFLFKVINTMFFDHPAKLARVRVSETPKTWAEYRP